MIDWQAVKARIQAGEIVRLGPGVSVYRNPKNDSVCMVVHYSADPLKRNSRWAAKESAKYDGGASGTKWRTEQEVDFDAEEGLNTFYAFDSQRNVVAPFPVPVNWRRWLAVDPGGTVPTAVLFLAQDPLSQRIVVYDEIYRAKVGTLALKTEAYAKVADSVGVPMRELRMVDWLETGFMDPARKQDIIDWNDEPFPVPIQGNLRKGNTGIAINSVLAGESRVNELLAPSFACCGTLWTIRDLHDVGRCMVCHAEKRGEPLLVIMGERCPNLVRTLPLVRRKPAVGVGLQAPEQDIAGVERHAPDALRYGVVGWSIEVGIGLPTTAAEAAAGVAVMDAAAMLDRVREAAYKREDDEKLLALEEARWEAGLDFNPADQDRIAELEAELLGGIYVGS